MKEENKPKEERVVSNEAVKKDAKSLLKNVRSFMSELLDIREDTDRDSTIEAVKKAGVTVVIPDKSEFQEKMVSLYDDYKSNKEIYDLITKIKAFK